MAKRKISKKAPSGNGGALVVGAFLLAVVACASWFYLTPKEVLVPSVVGRSLEDASAQLRNLGLTFQVEERPSSADEETPGTVIIQYPAAGSAVPGGSVISLVVVAAEEGKAVPDLVGKTRSEAEDILRRLGFSVEFKERKVDDVPIGRVVEQSPLAGDKLAVGMSVVVVVSGGRGDQEVPDLRELPLDLARELLSELGLEMSVQKLAQADFRDGDPVVVIRQEPEPGVKLPVGSRVIVTVPTALSPEIDPSQPGGIHAPRLEGLTVSEARVVADESGVELQLLDEANESSVVTFQEPPPGDPLAGQAPVVRVRVAASTVVPGLAGLSEEEARTRLRDAQLMVGGVSHSYGPVAGEVIGQRPSSGIEVVAGSGVDLVIADPDLSPSLSQDPPMPTPAFTPAPWVD